MAAGHEPAELPIARTPQYNNLTKYSIIKDPKLPIKTKKPRFLREASLTDSTLSV